MKLLNVPPDDYALATALAYVEHYGDDAESAFEENARLLWMSREKPNDWGWEYLNKWYSSDFAYAAP